MKAFDNKPSLGISFALCMIRKIQRSFLFRWHLSVKRPDIGYIEKSPLEILTRLVGGLPSTFAMGADGCLYLFGAINQIRTWSKFKVLSCWILCLKATLAIFLFQENFSCSCNALLISPSCCTTSFNAIQWFQSILCQYGATFP